MREMLAIVNEEGRFIRHFEGVCFDVWKLNTNHPTLGQQAQDCINRLFAIKAEYDALIHDFNNYSVASMEQAYKAFVVECRAKRDTVRQIKSMESLYVGTTNRLNSELTKAHIRLKEVKGNGPRPHDFPTDEEIQQHNAKVAQQQAIVDEVLGRVKEHDENYKLYTLQLRRETEELNAMTAKHDSLLKTLKGISEQAPDSVLGSSLGLAL